MNLSPEESKTTVIETIRILDTQVQTLISQRGKKDLTSVLREIRGAVVAMVEMGKLILKTGRKQLEHHSETPATGVTDAIKEVSRRHVSALLKPLNIHKEDTANVERAKQIIEVFGTFRAKLLKLQDDLDALLEDDFEMSGIHDDLPLPSPEEAAKLKQKKEGGMDVDVHQFGDTDK